MASNKNYSKTPNKTTVKAIKESKNHRKIKVYDSVDELLFDCLK